jgi:hypothetical protein
MASAAITMAVTVLWLPAPTASLMEGGRRLRKMARKRSVVRVHSWKEVLFELPHENTGLEALHFHGEAKQFKI